MKRLFAAISLVLLVWSAGTLRAESTGKVLKKLQKIYEQAVDFTADFQQKSYNRTFKKWIKGEGKVYLKKGGKMRWEYKGKNAQVIVSDGKTMWVYQPDAKEVIISSLKSGVARTPINFLEGMGNLNRDFKGKLIKLKEYPSSRYYVVELTPREEIPNLTRMVIVVDKKSMKVVEVRTYDFYQNENIIKFFNVKLNTGLPDSIFKFRIPPGTRVMKMPSR